MKVNRCLWASLLLLLAAPEAVLAQSNVESKVQKLEETIQVLERRVTDLEAQLSKRKVLIPVASDKATWRQLQKGMSEGDVENLLGSPSKIDVFGPFTVWHYDYQSGGRVQFDGDSRKVTSWFEP